MRKLRILALMDVDFVPPDEIPEGVDTAEQPWRTEYDVVTTLRELGHEVRPLGVYNNLRVLDEALADFKPHVTFNLLEEFHGKQHYDQHIVAYLELMQQAYTGCGPRGLVLARDKAISKQILAYHRINVPKFAVFRRGRVIKPSRKLRFPLFVKSLTAEASLGISQASIVDNADKLIERVQFIHDKIATDAIVEEYIDGRELYVSIIGNRRVEVFPIWELRFSNNSAENIPLIATEKVKFDFAYQEKYGVTTDEAVLSEAQRNDIVRKAKRIYRILGMSGYARLDIRMDAEERYYLLEANPNPQLAYGEDFAECAFRSGVDYPELLQRIINLGRRRGPDGDPY
jgi:D-alanine-D-alanine ligase